MQPSAMPSTAIQNAVQPFSKLVQANFELISKFALSPEVTKQAIDDTQNIFQQTQDSMGKLVKTHAFEGFTKGLMENYNQFVIELFNTASSTFSQSQAAFVHQAQAATDNIAETAQASARRVRAAA